MTTEAELYEALKYRVVIANDGTRRYYNAAGRLHRTDGPAVEYANGGTEWFQNGALHREDGPAAVYTDGSKLWFLHDKHYTHQAYRRELSKLRSHNGH